MECKTEEKEQREEIKTLENVRSKKEEERGEERKDSRKTQKKEWNILLEYEESGWRNYK